MSLIAEGERVLGWRELHKTTSSAQHFSEYRATGLNFDFNSANSRHASESNLDNYYDCRGISDPTDILLPQNRIRRPPRLVVL